MCLVLQVYCGIYYAVFLATALRIVIPLELSALPVERRRTLLRASVPVNTPLYEPIRTVLFAYRGLRAPARAGMLVYLAIAALAAFGWARLEKRFRRDDTRFRGVPVATAIVATLMLLEYATPMKSWFTVPPAPQVYRWLANQPRSVVLELPMSTADRLDIVPDGLYMFRSTEHWQPIVNGYSGFFPQSYLDLTERVTAFPDDASIDYLKTRGVDLIIVHGALMSPDRFGAIMAGLVARPDIRAIARYDEPIGPDVVFRLQR